MAIPYNANEIAGAVNRAIALELRDTARRVLSLVVQATPVGNPSLWQNPGAAPPGYVGGMARRNWLTTIGRPDFLILPGVDASGEQAIAQGVAVTEAIRNEPQEVYITNSVPYIGPLNDGHSSQAPAMFVEMAVLEAAQFGGGARVDIDA